MNSASAAKRVSSRSSLARQHRSMSSAYMKSLPGTRRGLPGAPLTAIDSAPMAAATGRDDRVIPMRAQPRLQAVRDKRLTPLARTPPPAGVVNGATLGWSEPVSLRSRARRSRPLSRWSAAESSPRSRPDGRTRRCSQQVAAPGNVPAPRLFARANPTFAPAVRARHGRNSARSALQFSASARSRRRRSVRRNAVVDQALDRADRVGGKVPVEDDRRYFVQGRHRDRMLGRLEALSRRRDLVVDRRCLHDHPLDAELVGVMFARG